MRLFAFVGLMIFLSACSSLGTGVNALSVSDLGKDGYPRHDTAGDIPKRVAEAVNAPYMIKPGDKLSIKFFFNPELNEEELIVRPDGRISLQLIHEVEAASLTAPQLRSLLAKRYAGQLKTPEIAVIVRSVKEAQKVFVGGQVKSPGSLEIIGALSVLQAITQVHGFVEGAAKTNEVFVMRKDQHGNSFMIMLDLTAALNGTDLSQDIQLHPFDYVHVPRSFW